MSHDMISWAMPNHSRTKPELSGPRSLRRILSQHIWTLVHPLGKFRYIRHQVPEQNTHTGPFDHDGRCRVRFWLRS